MFSRRSIGFVLCLCVLCAADADAQSAKPIGTAPSAAAPRIAGKPVIDGEPEAAKHPLAAVLKYAQESQRYAEQTVRNYTGRLIKRERIDGELSEYHYARIVVRDELRSGESVVTPFAVFMEYMAPAKIAGRKVLFVADQNDNEILVRRGGKRLSYVVVSLNPHGPTAQLESSVPITEVSFSRIIRGLVGVIEQQIKADPEGANTLVQHSANARLNGQPCSVIRVVHPVQDEELGFYMGTVYIDQKHHVPIRIESHGWPEQSGDEPPLMAEFTCADLKVNVALDEAQFKPEVVRGK